jgi:hypothetical protein
MLKNAAKAVGTVLAGAVLAMGLAGSAAAANQVDCAGRNDFVTLWSTNGVKYCFANGGALTMAIPVYQIGSGNNGVSVTFHDGSGVTLAARWLVDGFRGTVTRICIFNPDIANRC